MNKIGKIAIIALIVVATYSCFDTVYFVFTEKQKNSSIITLMMR